jgi:hypothetical protein
MTAINRQIGLATSTSLSLADGDGMPSREPRTRRWMQSDLFEWWPVALVAVLTIVSLIVVLVIGRTFV